MLPAWHHWVTLAPEREERMMDYQIDEVDDFGDTALHLACRLDSTDKASRLVRRGAKLDVQNRLGETPLMVAIKSNHGALVDILVHSGAALHIRNAIGETPLFVACKYGLVDIVKSIMRRSELDAPNPSKMTALSIAVLYGHEQVVKDLCQAGANVDAVVCHGWRPIHCAVLSRHPHTLQTLLSFGPHVDARDKNGKTALRYAQEMGFQVMIDLLTQVNNRSKSVLTG